MGVYIEEGNVNKIGIEIIQRCPEVVRKENTDRRLINNKRYPYQDVDAVKFGGFYVFCENHIFKYKG